MLGPTPLQSRHRLAKRQAFPSKLQPAVCQRPRGSSELALRAPSLQTIMFVQHQTAVLSDSVEYG